MNTSYYETLDENFNRALELYEKDFSHDELYEFLRNGNIVQKQIAALRICAVTSENDADVFMANLVGQDGKIREVVSFRLNEFMKNKAVHKFFLKSENVDIFLQAIIDINGNICRNIISAISELQDYPQFTECFCPKLTDLTKKLVANVNEFDFADGKYKVNKEVFKLYWCLETLYVFTNLIKFDILKEILMLTKSVGEYTIREKTAKILTKLANDADLDAIRQELKHDNNYYVRRF